MKLNIPKCLPCSVKHESEMACGSLDLQAVHLVDPKLFGQFLKMKFVLYFAV